MIRESLRALTEQIKYTFQKLTICKRDLFKVFKHIISILQNLVAIGTDFRYTSNPKPVNDVIKDYILVSCDGWFIVLCLSAPSF